MDIIALLLGGLIVGAVARLAVPGPQALGCLGTIAVGLLGGVIGGFIGLQLLGGEQLARRSLVSFLFSVLGAILVLIVLRSLAGRRRL
jgi:uncharacterized membrane protein YeaQ/YmgE (transglycosylase-associated protein family)